MEAAARLARLGASTPQPPPFSSLPPPRPKSTAQISAEAAARLARLEAGLSALQGGREAEAKSVEKLRLRVQLFNSTFKQPVAQVRRESWGGGKVGTLHAGSAHVPHGSREAHWDWRCGGCCAVSQRCATARP